MKYTYDVEDYDHAYLRVSNDDLAKAKIQNPLQDLTDWQKENYHLHILRIMRDPKYVYWTVKNLLNIDLLPEQCVILQEMWGRAFPMYVASRGYGKSYLLAVYSMLKCLLEPGCKIVLVGAAFRQSKVIFEYMDTLWRDAPLFRSLCNDASGPRRDVDRVTMRINESWTIGIPLGDGCLTKTSLLTYNNTIDFISIEHDFDNPNKEIITRKRNVWGNGGFNESDESYCNGVQPTKKITTKKGYTIEGTLNHKIKIYDSKNRTIGWRRFDEISLGDHPIIDRTERWHEGQSDISPEEAYAVGLMIGDGCWTHEYRLGFATQDIELAEALIQGTGLKWKQAKDIVHWDMNSKGDKAQWLSKYGLPDRCYAKDKTIPQPILSSSKEVVAACISALYDTDGHIQVQTAKGGTAITVGFTNTSEQLVDQLHFLLLHFGIISYKTFRDRDENWNRVYELLITGKDVRLFYERINFRLTRKRKVFNAGMQDKIRDISAGDIIPGLIPTMTEIAKENKRRGMPHISASQIVKRKEATRGFITDFCCKYKNSNPVIQTIEDLNDPNIYYDEVTSIEDGKAPTYDVHIPDSHEYCANGFFSHNTKIRGLRAHIIICDEFNSIPVEIYETVVAGFASVSKAPADNVKEAAKRKAMKKDKVWSDKQEETYKGRHQNQSILSGTAGYDFEPYASYWKVYKKMIAGGKYQGDDVSENEDDVSDELPEYMQHLNADQFSVIRMPYELIPEGFMDDQQVSRSRATMHSGIYLMEYAACVKSNTLITTDTGIKKIIDINIGDMVLTHKGRFRKVTKKLYRRYRDKIVKYKTYGYNQTIEVTPNHPFWCGEDSFRPIGDGPKDVGLVNLNELSGRTILNTEPILTDILETKNKLYFYPRGSKSNFNLDQQREIRENSSGKTTVALAQEYGVSQPSISYLQNNDNIPKHRIPVDIKLDYDFGLIIGYYASEGSTGAGGRQTGFALDEHKDTEYQKQLLQAINRVFGFQGKRYIQQKNTVVISINSRLVADIMKYICPGLSHTKLIRHDILFSNEEFLRGVIEGYWNGDGHIRDGMAVAQCVNQSMLNQFRLVLSYFNISSSLMDTGREETFKLVLTGNNYRDFMAEFYGKILLKGTRKQHLINDGEKTVCPILSADLIDYDDFVYNLEVEEDNSYSTLNATVHNCFAKDSQGFFKRTLIEGCTASDKNVAKPGWPAWCPEPFDVLTKGRMGKQYIFSIDPASENDNFAIIILELHPEHHRCVYSWTTNKKDFADRKRLQLTDSDDYYSFCVRKIRDLYRLFPCARIGIDSQGGGYAIAEGLRDKDKVLSGERLILPAIDDKKEQDTDVLAGDHILEFIQFASADWTSQANHGLRKDMEDKVLLFPRFDNISLSLVTEQDKIMFSKLQERLGNSTALKLYDTLEDVVMEVEELRTELSTITVSRTASGREKFDTPEIKLNTGKKGRMRKDRYSALVIGNMLARSIEREITPPAYQSIGRLAEAEDAAKIDPNKPMFTGSADWVGYSPKSVGVIRRS